MKKFLSTLLLTSCLLVTGCEASHSSGSAKNSLEAKGYTVSHYESDAEVKAHIQGFNFEGFTVSGAILARKGEGTTLDVFVAFYFSNIATASSFNDRNNNENLITMTRFLDSNLGPDMQPKAGQKDNVCYGCSTVAYAIVFGN